MESAMSLGQDKSTKLTEARLELERIKTLVSMVLFGALIGIVSPLQGTPWLAMPLVVILIIGAAALVRIGTRQETSFLGHSLNLLRRAPKATQYLLISFFVTTVFAVELRFDVAPNRYGFLELLVPVAIFAILFGASGGGVLRSPDHCLRLSSARTTVLCTCDGPECALSRHFTSVLIHRPSDSHFFRRTNAQHSLQRHRTR